MKPWLAAIAVLLTPSAQALPSIGEALEAPALNWSQSGTGEWVVVPVTANGATSYAVQMASSADPDGVLLEATLTTQIMGPARVSFKARNTYVPTDWDTFLTLDGSQMRLDSRSEEAWGKFALQLSAGMHTVEWTVETGVIMQLDSVVVTPGAGPLVSHSGAPAFSWLSQNAVDWTVEGSGPPGIVGGSVALTTSDASLTAFVPKNSVISGWLKKTGASSTLIRHGLIGSFVTTNGEWQQQRATVSEGMLTLRCVESGAASTLSLAGFSASPVLLGEILDAPEFVWTTPTVGWSISSLESHPHQTGSFEMNAGVPFSAMVTTQLTGPGKLFFIGHSQGFDPDGFRVQLDGADAGTWPVTVGHWKSFPTNIPAGTHTAFPLLLTMWLARLEGLEIVRRQDSLLSTLEKPPKPTYGSLALAS